MTNYATTADFGKVNTMHFMLSIVLLACSGIAMASTAVAPSLPAWLRMALEDSAGKARPDLQARRAGMRHLAEGRQPAALRAFVEASRYADKSSQAMVAFMFAQGIGDDQDPIKALAWMILAAERDYPTLVAEREKLSERLNDAQRHEARALSERLADHFGDAAGQELLSRVMTSRSPTKPDRAVTGSRVGNRSGVRSGSPNAEGKRDFSVGGGMQPADAPRPRRWNATRHWQAQDQLWASISGR